MFQTKSEINDLTHFVEVKTVATPIERSVKLETAIDLALDKICED